MKRLTGRALALMLVLSLLCSSALAAYATLRPGDSGAAVRKLQQALKSLGYSVGTVDGKYGAKTEEAVRQFQQAHGLQVDGVAGSKTQNALYGASGGTSGGSDAPVLVQGSYFGGDYSTVEEGQKGSRVLLLQSALSSLGYSCAQDASFGKGTRSAVMQFQRAKKLTVDGKAGRRTLQAIEQALAGGSGGGGDSQTTALDSGGAPTSTLRPGSKGAEVKKLQTRLKALGWYAGKVDGSYGRGTTSAVSSFQLASGLSADGVAGPKTLGRLFADGAASAGSSSGGSSGGSAGQTGSNTSFSVPGVGQVQLLHWFNTVKPGLKNKQHLLVYDPATGNSWTLQIIARGNHCDAEPLTRADTDAMVAAFGGQHTWTQRAVYVRLPSGAWTLASTHDMPHMSGSIKDNGFDGHLCVHFLRDMEECKKNDPKYGVSNQQTIRAAWKAMTGEDVP